MAYDLPTPASMRTRFPIFAALSDPTLQEFIDEAARSVDTTWIEGDYTRAIQYLAAHNIVTEGLVDPAGSSVSSAVAGPIKSDKLGDASTTWATPTEGTGITGPDALLARTIYGQRYLALRRASNPGVLIV